MALYTSIGFGYIFLLMVFAAIRRYRIRVSQAKILIISLIVMLAGFAYSFEPKPFIRWDLLEYYKLCDKMTKMSIQEAFTNSEYGQFVVINIFFYIIAHIGNYHLIPFIPLIIDCVVLYYVLFDTIYISRLTSESSQGSVVELSMVVFVLYAWFSTVSIKLAISGVRCTLAVALAFFAMYIEYIKGKNRLAAIVLYACAVLIHFSAVMIILIRLIATIKKIYIVPIAMNLFMLLGQPIVSLLRRSIGNQYLKLALFKFERYLNTFYILGNNFHLSRAVFIIYLFWIIIGVYFYTITRATKKQYKCSSDYEEKALQFSEAVGYVLFGCVTNYMYLQRMMYIIAFAMLLILPRYLSLHQGKTGFLKQILISAVMFYVLFMNDIYGLIVNYTGTYFLAR